MTRADAIQSLAYAKQINAETVTINTGDQGTVRAKPATDLIEANHYYIHVQTGHRHQFIPYHTITSILER